MGYQGDWSNSSFDYGPWFVRTPLRLVQGWTSQMGFHGNRHWDLQAGDLVERAHRSNVTDGGKPNGAEGKMDLLCSCNKDLIWYPLSSSGAGMPLQRCLKWGRARLLCPCIDQSLEAISSKEEKATPFWQGKTQGGTLLWTISDNPFPWVGMTVSVLKGRSEVTTMDQYERAIVLLIISSSKT